LIKNSTYHCCNSTRKSVSTEILKNWLGLQRITTFYMALYVLTLSLLMSYIYGAPCKARSFNVIYIYGPTFGNAESRLFLFAAQCFNIESIQKVFLYHSCV
jgi:hypothetical protein